MSKNYATARFRSLLFVSTFGAIVEYVVLLSHSVIVGWVLGTQALAALGIVTPFFSLIVFAAYMITNGTVILSNFAVGRQDRDEANRFFSQGVILSAGAGVVLTLCLLIFKRNVFSWFNVSPEILQYINEYFSVLLFLPISLMFRMLLYSIVINEGGEKTCTVSSVVQVICSVGLAIILCGTIGIAGCAVAFLIGDFIAALILCSHFFKKHCQLRFKWHIKVKDVLDTLWYSAGDSVSLLYITLFAMVMNIFLSFRFGDEAIVIFSIIFNFQSLMIIGLDGIGQAIQPLVSVYYGENNLHGIKKTMRTAFAFTLVESLAITALFLLIAPYIPAVFSITEAHLVSQTAFALRVYSLTAVFWGILILLITYYTYTAKLALCHIISPLLLFVCPALLCFAAPKHWGLEMNWTMMAAAVFPATALSLLIIKRISKNRTFPLLLDKDELNRQFSCDAMASAEGVGDIMNKVEEEMRRRSFDNKTANKVLLVIEEVSMLSVEKSVGKKFYIECTLIFGEKITLTLRDGGVYTDSTEDIAPGSMVEFFRRNIIAAHKYKKFSLSGGDNRTVFHF